MSSYSSLSTDEEKSVDGVLRKIGASWFVSYAYYKNVDSTHKNWNSDELRKASIKGRISRYDRNKSCHAVWLKKVCDEMDAKRLGQNKLKPKLSGEQVKRMARELLEKLDK